MHFTIKTGSIELTSQLPVESLVVSERSWYQKIAILQSRYWGKILTLDDRVITTEREAPVFQEMFSHIPLFLHSNPQQVLVSGAAWGGLVCEVVRHPEVQQVVQVEPDDALIDIADTHWLQAAVAGTVPRSKLIVEAWVDYAEKNPASQDVLLMDLPSTSYQGDLSQPIAAIATVLHQEGIAMLNIGSPYENRALISEVHQLLKRQFTKIIPFALHAPIQVGGLTFGFFCSNRYSPTLRSEHQAKWMQKGKAFRYYNLATHSAAFVQPHHLVFTD